MTALLPMRAAALRDTLREKRSLYPALIKPLTGATLRDVLRAEGLRLEIRPHGVLAQLAPRPSGWRIILDSSATPYERLVGAAHELGHLWLHHDALFSRSDLVVYDYSAPWWSEMEELEADTFATELLKGASPPKSAWPRYGAHTFTGSGRIASLVASSPITDPALCPLCGIELGVGRGKFPQAKGADCCYACAMDIDPPFIVEEPTCDD